ncbi:MAG: ribonuclease HI family protein [Elusimicrobiaceae bacterium]|nr:ribonuclease HI family protein [Elusimicrobiaceae bacterium]
MELFINVDGGSRGNPGPGASGWIIKDKNGNILVKEGLFFKECTNNQAEFTALKMALKAASDFGKCSLNIKADSQLMVRQYLGEYKIKNPELQFLMGEIKQLAANFKQIVINHVPREQNKEADEICNIIMDRALKNVPIKPVLTSDLPKQEPAKEIKKTETKLPPKEEKLEEPKKLQPAVIKKAVKKSAPKKETKKVKAEKDPIFTKTNTAKKAKKTGLKKPVQLELFDKI